MLDQDLQPRQAKRRRHFVSALEYGECSEHRIALKEQRPSTNLRQARLGV